MYFKVNENGEFVKVNEVQFVEEYDSTCLYDKLWELVFDVVERRLMCSSLARYRSRAYLEKFAVRYTELCMARVITGKVLREIQSESCIELDELTENNEDIDIELDEIFSDGVEMLSEKSLVMAGLKLWLEDISKHWRNKNI